MISGDGGTEKNQKSNERDDDSDCKCIMVSFFCQTKLNTD